MIIGRNWFKRRPHYRYALQIGEVNRFIENLYILYDGRFPAPIEQLVFEIVSLLDNKEAAALQDDSRLRKDVAEAVKKLSVDKDLKTELKSVA